MKRLLVACVGMMFCLNSLAIDAPSGSYQEHYANRVDNNHWVILGAIERIKGRVSPEAEAWVKGKVTEWLWRLPMGVDSKEGFEAIKKQVSSNSIALFECESRGCGASNDFANQVFEQSILYGRESFQNYWVGLQKAKSTRETDYVWVLYTGTRSNKRSYAYLEKIALSQGEIEKFDVYLEKSQTDQFMKLGYRVLAGAEQSAGLSKSQISWISTILAENQQMNFALVVHLSDTQPVDRLVERSQVKAQTLVDQLVKKNAFVANLYSHGAGPMMPRPSQADTRVELVRLPK